MNLKYSIDTVLTYMLLEPLFSINALPPGWHLSFTTGRRHTYDYPSHIYTHRPKGYKQMPPPHHLNYTTDSTFQRVLFRACLANIMNKSIQILPRLERTNIFLNPDLIDFFTLAALSTFFIFMSHDVNLPLSQKHIKLFLGTLLPQ